MSKADWIRISMSIFGPNAFSILKAISPDKSALPFKRLDSAGRENSEDFCSGQSQTNQAAL